MATSRIPATINAVVTALRNAGLKVWDGPVITGDYGDAVYIGYDGNPEGEFQSTSGTQSWAGLGAKRRNERFTIFCAVVALVGDSGDVQGSRENAYALLAGVEDALRADPSLGQPPPFVAAMNSNDLFLEQGDAGLQSRIVFTIDVEIARV